MPDSPAGGAAFLNGEEIVNDSRTLAYLEAGYGPKRMKIDGGCACPNIRELIECGNGPYVSPMADPAPWYDASIPESADFAGFLTVDFDGMGSTYKRIVIDKITGGATLGRLTAGPRTLRWRGFLFGRSDCAVRYGLSWMAANLKGTNCACTGEDLDILVCCPELKDAIEVDLLTELENPLLTESEIDIILETLDALVDIPDCDGLLNPARPEVCPPFTQPDAFRLLKNVGLLEGPIILSERKVGCGISTCTEDDNTVIIEVEFSLLAENPYLYGCEVCLCVDQSFPVNDDEDCSTSEHWEKWTDAEVAALYAERVAAGDTNPIVCPGGCDPVPDCTRLDNGCPPATLPFIPVFQDKCFCEPIDPVQFCCSVPADSFGQFFEGAPVITIFSGSKSMRATTVRFFANPQGLDCCDVANNPCLNCDSLQIKFIPASSTLTIDGVTRTVTVLCPGMTTPIIADHLTVTPFSWPILQCVNFCICVETEGGQVAPDAWVSISVVPREM